MGGTVVTKVILTESQREMLFPFAEAYEKLVIGDVMSDEEKRALLDAALACSPTNCGWSMYRAAKIILGEMKLDTFAER